MPYICDLCEYRGPKGTAQHNSHQPPELQTCVHVSIVSPTGKEVIYAMKKASKDRFRQLGFLNMVMNVAFSSFSAST